MPLLSRTCCSWIRFRRRQCVLDPSRRSVSGGGGVQVRHKLPRCHHRCLPGTQPCRQGGGGAALRYVMMTPDQGGAAGAAAAPDLSPSLMWRPLPP